MGGVVLKEVSPGKASAEVGYWTADSARGQGVAPRALEAVTAWSLDAPAYPLDGHLHVRHSAA